MGKLLLCHCMSFCHVYIRLTILRRDFASHDGNIPEPTKEFNSTKKLEFTPAYHIQGRNAGSIGWIDVNGLCSSNNNIAVSCYTLFILHDKSIHHLHVWEFLSEKGYIELEHKRVVHSAEHIHQRHPYNHRLASVEGRYSTTGLELT
jgi:hypothetical protein